MTKNYTLYAAKISLYSGKARAYLRYKNIPYDEVLSTLSVYKKIILPETGVRFIPVVKTPDGEHLQDTTNIIDQLEQKFPDRSVYPVTPKQHLVSLLLELYGDEWLLIPAMHYRWIADDLSFIYREFGNIVSPKLPGFIKKFIGKKIGQRFKKLVPGLGITDKTIPEIESWYEKFLVDLDNHFSRYPYLLGDAPCIGDFSFFGSLHAHLYRDPYPRKLMEKLAPNVVNWVKRMKNPPDVSGKFLPGDEIPDSLLPVLTHLFKEHWPILQDTSNRLSLWYKDHKANTNGAEPTEIPRNIGKHRFKVNGVQEERKVLPYSQWMMQRPLSFYNSISTQDKVKVDEFLNQVNGFNALQFAPGQKVTRINNRFVIDGSA